MQADLEIGSPAEVIGPLRDLVNADPWDERPWRLLLLALYRADRHADALHTAREVRRVFDRHRGLDLSPDFAALERGILRHDPSLRPRRERAARPVGPLFGRQAELSWLAEQWTATIRESRSRLVVLSGEPAIGKSHLMAHSGFDVGRDDAGVLVGRCLDEPRLPWQPGSEFLDDRPDQPPAQHAFAAVLRRFGRALESRPTLMVAEDLQWASVAAIRLLERILALTEAGRYSLWRPYGHRERGCHRPPKVRSAS